MTLIADITNGHTLLADWLFLVAAVLLVLAALGYAPKTVTPKLSPWAAALVAVALALVALAFLLL